MKILFLIQNYHIIDGSSMALYEYINENKSITEYKILCRRYTEKQPNLNIDIVNSSEDIKNEILKEDYNIIHYFKTHGYDLFNWTLKAIVQAKKRIPIVTTICQRPSYKGMLLSPKEIEKSNILVHIDIASLNDNLYKFIPTNKKFLNYFGRQKSNLDLTENIRAQYKSNSKFTIIGRGSSLNKCPKDIIQIYDKLKIPNKKLIIVGITPNSWLHQICKNRSDITLIPPVPYIEWLKICNSFDIFWYYIPSTSHSSIDGTLGDAMLLGKPIVYMGSEAPKERFKQDDGFIASNKAEMISYLNILSQDKNLRDHIGENARKTIIENFSLTTTITNYNYIYNKINNINYINTKIPVNYKLYFYLKSIKAILRSAISGTYFEKLLINHNSKK